MDDVILAALQDVEALEKRAALEISDDEIGSIQKLAAEQVRLEDFLAELESVQKKAGESLRLIREQKLPDALMAAKVKSFELDDGSKVSLSKKYIGSITKENEDEALAWFINTKRAGVVTPNMSIPVGKGELEKAEAIAGKLEAAGIEYTLKPGVHWQTLRAVVRELYESGEEIPKCISTHVFNEATIKRK